MDHVDAMLTTGTWRGVGESGESGESGRSGGRGGSRERRERRDVHGDRSLLIVLFRSSYIANSTAAPKDSIRAS